MNNCPLKVKSMIMLSKILDYNRKTNTNLGEGYDKQSYCFAMRLFLQPSSKITLISTYIIFELIYELM